MTQSWIKKSIEEFVQFQRGFDLPREDFIEGATPVYGSNSIIGYHNLAKAKAPGLITGRSGTLGQFQFSEVDYWPHNTTLWVKSFNGNIPKFAYYALQCFNFAEMNSGGAVPTLNRNVLRSYKLLVPPLPTQQKIANILSAYDDLIENNLKRIKLLEELAQITYEEWFVRLRFPNHENVAIDEETGLPEGWSNNAISTVCNINKNSISVKTAPKEIKYIDISMVETGKYETPEKIEFSTAPSRARRKVIYGDTIFSTVRPNRRTFCLILESDPILVASTGFAVLSPNQQDDFPFIYSTIVQQSFTDSAVAVAGGAAYPAINQTDFERIKITVPNSELINKFCQLTKSYFVEKQILVEQNENLKQARDILLPRLMTGSIDVDTYISNIQGERSA